MNVVRFVDTNVILHAYDLDEPRKRRGAAELMREWWQSPEKAAVSVQVLRELRVNLSRKGIGIAEGNQIVREGQRRARIDFGGFQFGPGSRWNCCSQSVFRFLI